MTDSTPRIALITGASRGLGRSAALHLAAQGVQLIITYKDSAAAAQEVVAQIEALGSRAVALRLDVGDSKGFAAFAEEVKAALARTWQREQFDYLVNNAGVGFNAPFAETTEAQFDMLVNVHLKGTFFLTQKLLPLIADGGRIVNTSSGLARFSFPGYAAYAVMKGGVEVLTRYLAKELGPRGITVNLVHVAPAAIDRLPGPVRFFCGTQTTYVTGQAVHLDSRVGAPESAPAVQVLAGQVALVTGAARGIGLAIAQRLAEEGARVVALDVPAAGPALHAACTRFGFTPLAVDIADADAPRSVAAFLHAQGGVDIVVHNAGVTRDRRLANMKEPYWDLVLEVNFGAVAALDAALLDGAVLRDGGRIVCLSSISGIAGNVGQSNYAMSKAALIGYVAAQAGVLAMRGICINAVAPGFIETPMTDAMPFILRELGRRANSLKQGGQPRDVAEAVTFLATPGAVGITGQTIRVCGQALLGA